MFYQNKKETSPAGEILFHFPNLVLWLVWVYAFLTMALNVGFFSEIGFQYILLFGVSDLLVVNAYVARILIIIALFMMVSYMSYSIFLESGGAVSNKNKNLAKLLILFTLGILDLITLYFLYFSDKRIGTWFEVFAIPFLIISVIPVSFITMRADRRKSTLLFIMFVICVNALAFQAIGSGWAKYIIKEKDQIITVISRENTCSYYNLLRSSSSGILIRGNKDGEISFIPWGEILSISSKNCS